MDQLAQEIYAKKWTWRSPKRSYDSESDIEEYEPQRKLRKYESGSESEDEVRPPIKRRLSSSTNEEEIRPPSKRRHIISSSDSEDEIRPPFRRRLVISSSDSSDVEVEAPALPQNIQPVVIKNSNFSRKGNKSAIRPRDEKGRFLKCPFTLPSHQSKRARKSEVDKLIDSSFLGVGVDPCSLLDLPSRTRSGLKFR